MGSIRCEDEGAPEAEEVGRERKRGGTKGERKRGRGARKREGMVRERTLLELHHKVIVVVVNDVIRLARPASSAGEVEHLLVLVGAA